MSPSLGLCSRWPLPKGLGGGGEQQKPNKKANMAMIFLVVSDEKTPFSISVFRNTRTAGCQNVNYLVGSKAERKGANYALARAEGPLAFYADGRIKSIDLVVIGSGVDFGLCQKWNCPAACCTLCILRIRGESLERELFAPKNESGKGQFKQTGRQTGSKQSDGKAGTEGGRRGGWIG